MTDKVEKREEGPPEPWEKDFLEKLVNEYAVIGKAARAANVSVKAVERRRKESPRFAALLAQAESMIDEALEYENIRRALEPKERPMFQRGQLVGTMKEWDTKHLEWVLERRFPEKYHLGTRIEVGGRSKDDLVFKLSLGDSEPAELESGEETADQ